MLYAKQLGEKQIAGASSDRKGTPALIGYIVEENPLTTITYFLNSMIEFERRSILQMGVHQAEEGAIT